MLTSSERPCSNRPDGRQGPRIAKPSLHNGQLERITELKERRLTSLDPTLVAFLVRGTESARTVLGSTEEARDAGSK